MLHTRHLVLWLLLISSIGNAQVYEQYYPTIKDGTKILYNAGAGAMISPQFSQMDFDGDGNMDLFVFDRSGDQVKTFLYKDGQYRYDSKYENSFPDLHHFALLRDYNNDGLQDVFTLSKDVPGVEVWKNLGQVGNPSFEKISFVTYKYPVLNYKISSGYSNIYVSEVDIPAIYDVDGDGDLDILTFDQTGARMQFFKNLIKEENLSFDAFKYELSDDCFGKFFENEFTEQIGLSSTQAICAQGFHRDAPQLRHSGSATLAFDPDGDGLTDLILGDLASNNVVYLHNAGTQAEAWMDRQIVKFPSNIPVDIDIFNGAYEIDVDNDGSKDLLFAPNNSIGSDDINNVWYYKNKSQNGNINYELVTKSFIQDTRLNIGKYTYPVLVDYNADGLQDILVGSSGYTEKGRPNGRLFLFEHMSNHEFRLVNDDYLNMSTLRDENLRLAPAIGDIDDDGDDDLIVGNSIGYFFFFENTAGKDKPYQFAQFKYKYANIRPGINVRPQLFDVDEDGWVDLVSGEKNDNQSSDGSYYGGVNFYKNNNGAFDSDVNADGNTPVLGGIYTREVGVTTTGESSPFFIQTNTGLKCIVGTSSGRIRLYDNIKDNLYGKFNEAISSLPVKDFGNTVSVTLGNLDDDKFYEMIIGSASGGLYFYNTDIPYDGLVDTKEIETDSDIIYPTITSSIFNVVTENIKRVVVYNLNGQIMTSTTNSQINIQDFAPGMYFVKVLTDDEKIFVSKVVKM